MSAPRHLWSGDWRSESSSHAEDLAARRARRDEPDPSEPVVPTPRQGRARLAIRMLRDRLRRLRPQRRRRLGVGWLAAVLTLLAAGAAYAVASDLIETNSPQAAAISDSRPWLGVHLTSAPVRGAMVATVVPGSPAAAAGIKPGDVITALDTEPIVTPAIFVSAISGLQPGDTVEIQLQRGASQYTAHVVLARRPVSGP